MKRIVLWGIGIVAGIAYVKFVGMSHAGECEALEEKTNTLLASLQTCESDRDCTFERLSCPFPCIAPLNRSAKEHVITAITAYNKQCMMMCPDCDESAPARVACIENACTAVP